jgi:hypothetical protein
MGTTVLNFFDLPRPPLRISRRCCFAVGQNRFHVVVIGFRRGRSRRLREHIYWDQATLLVQVGLLDAALLPVAAAEKAKRPTHPANEMIHWSRLNPR